MERAGLASKLLWVLGLGVTSACSAAGGPGSPGVGRAPERAAAGGAAEPERVQAGAPTERPAAPAPDPPAPECPDGMLHVRHDFCPDMRRRCLKSEYDRSNHITICHRFAPDEQRCAGERVALDFCIDRYEFPNRKGGHPPVQVSWYDAMGACAAVGKRLCYESEWTAACEGPEETPFPYGWNRSSEMCNIDNRWINPNLKATYSSDPEVQARELARLDQSVPSGSMESCRSGYGVYDLTGNFDEWTLADRDRPGKRADFAALKGGAWGHVRNACRPVTTSHSPDFEYYFVSFRCCADSRTLQETAAPALTAPAPADG